MTFQSAPPTEERGYRIRLAAKPISRCFNPRPPPKSGAMPVHAQNSKKPRKHRVFGRRSHTVIGMLTLLSALAYLLSFRVRSRLTLELELVALRHRYERRAA